MYNARSHARKLAAARMVANQPDCKKCGKKMLIFKTVRHFTVYRCPLCCQQFSRGRV